MFAPVPVPVTRLLPASALAIRKQREEILRKAREAVVAPPVVLPTEEFLRRFTIRRSRLNEQISRRLRAEIEYRRARLERIKQRLEAPPAPVAPAPTVVAPAPKPVVKPEKEEVEEEIVEVADPATAPTWSEYLGGKAAAGARIGVSIATTLGVNVALAAALGPVGAVVAAPIAMRAKRVAEDAAFGLIPGMSRRPPAVVGATIAVPKGSVVDAADAIQVSGFRKARDNLVNWVWSNAAPVLGTTAATGAASAIATGAIAGVMNYGAVQELGGFLAGLGTAYATGNVPGYALSGTMKLLSSSWAQAKAVQWVSGRIGWNTIGGRVGQKIHEMLEENERLGRSVLTDEQKAKITELIGAEGTARWIDTTWAQIVAGVARDYVDVVTTETAKRSAQEVGEGLGTVVAAAADGGLAATAATLQDASARAYEATAEALTATGDALATATSKVGEAGVAIGQGVKSGLDSALGTVQADPAQQQAEATQRAMQRIRARAEERELGLQEKFEADVKRTMETLQDERAMQELAKEFAREEKGALEMAAIGAQGLKFTAVGYQVAGALGKKAAGKLETLKDTPLQLAAADVTRATTTQQKVWERVGGRLVSDMVETATTEQSVREYLVDTTVGAVTEAVNRGLSTYEYLRMGSIFSANAAEYMGIGAQSEDVQDWARWSREYLRQLPSVGEIIGMTGLAPADVPQVDLEKVVLLFIFQRYLNPFGYKTTEELVADVVDQVAWGSEVTEDQKSEVRVWARDVLASLLDSPGLFAAPT